MSEPTGGLNISTNFIQKAINILTKPKEVWAGFKSDGENSSKVLTTFVLPMVAIPVIIGIPLFLVFGYWGATYGIVYAVFQFIILIALLYLDAFITNALAPSFNSKPDFDSAFKLLAYASTPGYVASIFSHIPVLNILLSLGALVYTIYLMYLGLPVLMETPQDKVVVYIVVIILIMLVIYFILFAVAGAILASLFVPSIFHELRNIR
jgi:hypothetical protein